MNRNNVVDICADFDEHDSCDSCDSRNIYVTRDVIDSNVLRTART